MPEYRVTWEIEVDADGPWEAAEQARAIQLDRQSTAVVFTAQRRDGSLEPVTVDLDEPGDEPLPARTAPSTLPSWRLTGNRRRP